MDKIEDGGPAFPRRVDRSGFGGTLLRDDCPGMSLRDYFAAKAMQAIVIGNNADECTMGAGCATDAYVLADAMLAARAK